MSEQDTIIEVYSASDTIEVIENTTIPNTIEVVNNTTILVGDLPQGYPLSWTVGNLPISRVSGLNIVGSTGIVVISNSGIYTIALSGSLGLNAEEVDDRVSNLLNGGSGINISYDDNNNLLIISATGLQPSGNYSVVGHEHLINEISGLQNILDNKQASGNYAQAVHSHGNLSNSGAIGSISGLLVITDTNGILTTTSGIVSEYITNFNSSVSGILPVTNISAGSGIQVSVNNSNFTIGVTGTFGLTSEQVDDRVSNLLVSGSYINLNYDDNLDTLTISATGLQPSGNYSINGHTHIIGDISGLQSSLDNKQPSGIYASGIHYHVSSDITDFNSAVSGLIPANNISSISGVSGVIVTVNNTDYIIGLSNPTIEINDITDLNNNAKNFLITSSSNNFQTLLLDKTGSGLVVFNNSPSFSGIPIAPTAATGTNTSQIASTAFVRSEIANLVDSAPSTLDTLNELAAALGDDPNFATTITNSLAGKANLSGSIFTGSITIPSGTGNFNNLTVNSVLVSLSGHNHISTDITDFNSSVSGLLPAVTGIGYVNSSFDNNRYTISVTGLQPSGSYASGIHYHSYTDITDFSSGVSGLIPITAIFSGNNIAISQSGTTYTISTTGLQTSGNYSVVGHNHIIGDVSGLQIALDSKQPSGNYASTIHSHGNITTDGNIGNTSGLLVITGNSGIVTTTNFIDSSYISNFNSTVSGLLPVKDIVAGSGISVGSTSGIYTITVAGTSAASASSLVTEVYNNTASTIPKMSVVYINGGQGNLPTITLAIANGEAGSSKTYGITSSAIGPNNNGNVTVIGALIDVNTDQFGVSPGTTLYLSPTVSGGITTTKPLAPNHLVSVGTVVRNHITQGVIEVRIQNGFELYELHDVKVSGVTDGQFLQYNSASGLWVPSSSGNFSTLLVNGTGVSVSGHNHTSSNITDFNSSVSGLLPVKNIIAGTNISINNTSGDYTISVSGSLGLTTEEVDDRVSSLLVAGSGINLSYNDNSNSLTISTLNNKILSDVVSSTNYIGVAPYNSLSSAEVWKIYKTIYSSDGSVSSNTSATNVAWDNRYSVTYS